MQGSTGLLDIIITVLILAFIVTRFLSSELPKETKEDRKKNNKKRSIVVPFPEDTERPSKKAKPRREVKNLDDLSGMEQIQTLDKSFKEKEFIEGARGAYFMFYEALNELDEETLDDLTAPRVFDRFMEKVESLEAKGQKQVIEIKELISAEVVDAKVHGKTAIIDVKYKAKHAEYITDSEDKVVSGSETELKEVDSVWTWARNVNDEDPNWELEDIAKLA